MKEDDEKQSHPSSGDPSTAKSLARDGLALLVSPPNQAASGRRIGGGGRDDCWSEEVTEILINAWGERFLKLKRGNLKQQHWKEVAEIVNRDNKTKKSAKTDIQCKNRIDTVKKKFKLEKAKIAASGDDDYYSKWIFFKKLERLIGGATTASKALNVSPLSSRSNLYQRQAKPSTGVKRSGDSTRWHFRKRVASETESESEPDLSADSGDSRLPPPLLLPPPVEVDKTELGEVAMSILGFAESYEKVETVKLKQMMELEKERMKLAKELELQTMQFFKAQLEMLRNSQESRR